MPIDTKRATLRAFVPIGNAEVGRGPIIVDSTVEASANSDANSIYTMCSIPTNARIHGMSRLSWDDLASAGAPTLDIGFKAIGGNFTTDPDALNDGLDAATANAGAVVIKDFANNGKFVWEFLGLTADPGGMADVTVGIFDATANTGGTITLSLAYSVA